MNKWIAICIALGSAFPTPFLQAQTWPQRPVKVIVPFTAGGHTDTQARIISERLSVALVHVLRHELAHSFIRARTGGNCPVWLQEGIAQWLEGGDPRREDAVVASAARAGRMLSLLTLEGPFQSLPPEQVGLAYAESLSAVAHIVRTRGEGAIVRLLAGLGDRLPAEEALPVALALSYPEFQKSWEDALRSLPPRS